MVFALQAAGMLLPLVSFPYLSRTLEPAAYGAFQFANSFGMYLQLIIGFGFDMSATRDIAQVGEDRQLRGRILVGVLSAQILLALVVTVPALALGCFMPIFRQWPCLLPLGIMAGLVQGFSLTWYFQGINRLPFASTVTLLAQAICVALIITFVHRPADAPYCLVCSLVPNLVGNFLLWHIARKSAQCPKIDLKYARETLSAGLSYFKNRAANSFMVSISPILVGVAASNEAVAYFTASSRVANSLWMAINPLITIAYPQIAHLRASNQPRAFGYSMWLTIVMTSWAVIIGISCTLYGQYLLHILAGNKFLPASASFICLAWALPATAINTALSWFWLLPLKQENRLLCPIVISGILNVVLGCILSRSYGSTGMALAYLFSEVTKTIGISMVALRMHHKMA